MFSYRAPIHHNIAFIISLALLSCLLISNSAKNVPHTKLICDIPIDTAISTSRIEKFEQNEDQLITLKKDLQKTIESLKSTGMITSAAIYYKDLSSDKVLSINDQEKYMPGSMMKIPALITFLKMAESNPEIVKQTYVCQAIYKNKVVTFPSHTLETGKSYSVKDLLYHMIVYSDNSAAVMLMKIIDANAFKSTFTDLGLPAVSENSAENLYTVKDFSAFLESLYHSSYLAQSNSQYALSLLSESDFNQGIKAGLPTDIKLAHKFGESGTVEKKELHETAIVYLNNKNYLLTIMCKGNDLKTMPKALSTISKQVYTRISGTI